MLKLKRTRAQEHKSTSAPVTGQKYTLVTCVLVTCVLVMACASTPKKIPVIYDVKPTDPYEVIGIVETKTEWHGLQWAWFWWHYMPWQSAIYKKHNEALIKKAQKLGADAVINITYFPKRQGAQGEAIRFK
ncbi:MAG: hypothetical protein COV74_09925 [Candidatus Omnitrophica bacterium CG11_big_fil_rev_8_21_14_0_20_45_26]|uniref:Uncharacterized protein n=1 Tax=Candidatus Abzuiibacterium crystallinum TaxID=1974748 RepID=A0A2H0LP44_9BACT|nr:MAG: hypothetical protein COV74_09925 [Candidatus Omnitrophica bacterium CG11_big_fil_rev_8_21_14_0_20_45_26]PIW64524.1 MAG: hypothetical protein COW12_06050 [Candidatus Omnitrophica bacterium CG12_big_fil_rev_8_21_14_0_65_45_16]